MEQLEKKNSVTAKEFQLFFGRIPLATFRANSEQCRVTQPGVDISELTSLAVYHWQLSERIRSSVGLRNPALIFPNDLHVSG